MFNNSVASHRNIKFHNAVQYLVFLWNTVKSYVFLASSWMMNVCVCEAAKFMFYRAIVYYLDMSFLYCTFLSEELEEESSNINVALSSFK